MLKLSRRGFISSALLSLAGYSAFIEPSLLRVRQKRLQIPNLPPAFEGFKIAHLTDFHFREYNRGLIERAVEKAKEWQPDLVALTGDFVDKSEYRLAELLEVLVRLESRLGSYACLGNHDHYHQSASHYQKVFDETPIRLLVNESVKEGDLEIIGVDSIYASTPDFQIPVGERRQEKLRLVLAHEPDMFDQIVPAYSPHLQLSGHTHGGQCRVPFVGYAPFTPKYGRKYKDGEFSQGDSSLFVSSGLGTSVARLRFACLPEVALLTLQRV